MKVFSNTYCGCVVVGSFAIYVKRNDKLVKTLSMAIKNLTKDVKLERLTKCVIATEFVTYLSRCGFEPLITCDDLEYAVERVVIVEPCGYIRPIGWVDVFNTNKQDTLRWRGSLQRFTEVDWTV